MREEAAYGVGIATYSDTKVLDTWFVGLGLGEMPPRLPEAVRPSGQGSTLVDQVTLGVLAQAVPEVADLPALFSGDTPYDRRRAAVVTCIPSLAAPPVDAYDAYLRLHLLSNRFIAPNDANLDGIFGLLSNVVWTDVGPFDPDTFDRDRRHLRTRGVSPTVFGIDKFPRMVDYVVPTGVRIADADRVRLGAHLGVGTTVMHEGFVNYNAGTLGASMVEGRISAGVVVGDGSDVGGGASIMGTLSGGGKERITIGQRSLLGANSGIGISLGDDCIVEAGLYVTAGSLVTLPEGDVVKAAALSGRSGMLFRRNSRSGAIEVLPNRVDEATWGGLNTDLHSN